MIQRIQSIFLLFTAILMAVTVFSPLVGLTDGGKLELTFFPWGIGALFNAQHPTWGVLTFAVLGALLPFINIFLYKKRKLQMKIGTATSLIIIFFYITFYVYLSIISEREALTFGSIQYGIILPVIALVFNILAILRIKKDEKLIQSLNRIR